jgi:nitroimidazol reductase NimA-like FMN-containing flavoprotein (pyridoxamine 5'-phosphate oxidase superfamily)
MLYNIINVRGDIMFRKMRRMDKAMDEAAALELLKKCEYGIVSTIGSDGYPYGVPVNYAYKDGFLYFHCATTGHKLDNIMENSKVSFCAVGESEIISKNFSTKYESVILFGKASLVEDDNEKKEALLEIIKKYSPNYIESGKKYIESDFDKAKVVKIEIEHITGKKAKE